MKAALVRALEQAVDFPPDWSSVMNREWHQQHKMPSPATEAERVKWHLEHAQACACRPFPSGLMNKLSEAERRQVTKTKAGRE
jgi:hypothetical protein